MWRPKGYRKQSRPLRPDKTLKLEPAPALPPSTLGGNNPIGSGRPAGGFFPAISSTMYAL